MGLDVVLEKKKARSTLKNRRATISLGYITVRVATESSCNNWENNPEAKEFTLDIIICDMKRRVEEWSDQYGYHFSSINAV